MAALVAASSVSAQSNPAEDVVVQLEEFKVVAEVLDKRTWYLVRTADFEALSSLEDESRTLRILSDFQSVVSGLKSKCSLFNLGGELPTKIILIQDRDTKRLMDAVDKKYGEHAIRLLRPEKGRISRPKIQGLDERSSYNPQAQMSVLRKLTKEQVLLLVHIPEERLRYPDNHILVSSLLNTYLRICLTKYRSEYNHNLLYAFAWTKMLSLDSSERGYFRGDFGYWGRKVSWWDLDPREPDAVQIRRHDFEREKEIFKAETKQEPPKEFLNAPDIDLREVIENPASFRIRFDGSSSPAAVERAIKYKREITDFSFYCAFGPEQNNRTGYLALLRYTRKQAVSEDVFIQCFGKDYAQFQEEMYGYFRSLSKGRNPSPWGAARFTIPVPRGESPALDMGSRKASESARARMMAEWFLACKATDLAGRILKSAREHQDFFHDREAVATLGLYEAEHGERNMGISTLELAASGKVRRPEVYRELSRLRLEKTLAAKGANARLTKEDVEEILKPLETLFKEYPPFPRVSRSKSSVGAGKQVPEKIIIRSKYPFNKGTWVYLMDVWDRADAEPPAETLNLLALVAFMSPSDLSLISKIVPFLRKHGFQESVESALESTGRRVLTDSERQLVDALHETSDELPSLRK